MDFVEAGKTQDIPEGTMKSFTLGGEKVLISNINGKFYAINGTCTHMGGDLARGKLEGSTVTCPRHKARFDVTSGECLSGPKMFILKPKIKNENTYEVQVEGDVIKVKTG